MNLEELAQNFAAAGCVLDRDIFASYCDIGESLSSLLCHYYYDPYMFPTIIAVSICIFILVSYTFFPMYHSHIHSMYW